MARPGKSRARFCLWIQGGGPSAPEGRIGRPTRPSAPRIFGPRGYLDNEEAGGGFRASLGLARFCQRFGKGLRSSLGQLAEGNAVAETGGQAAGAADSVMRRKLAAGRAGLAEGGPGADRSWRLGLARAARDKLKLPLEVASLVLDRCSLAELLELPPERAMIVVLEGPAEGLGLLVISPPVLAGMIEVQTIGKVGSGALAPRKPTRTDAAMVEAVIDAALEGMEASLEQEADLVWAGGFRAASFLDDPRPLGLLLEDIPYRVLKAEVSLAQGARSGPVLLALPAQGRGPKPVLRGAQAVLEAEAGPAFAEALMEQIAGSNAVMTGILARFSMSLNRVLKLAVGDLVVLSGASIERIGFEGLDGRKLAEGKLGQNRGMRAVRLTPDAVSQPRMPQSAGQMPHGGGRRETDVAAEPLRHTG